MARPRPLLALAVLVLVLAALALVRPIDHDESQYVAAAALSAGGLIPYRDYAYLQTPLQPLAFAPLAWAFGGVAYPGLRLVNALLGAVAVGMSFVAMRRLGARAPVALACAALFAACDILLFSAGTARNDALPAAMMAAAIAIVVVPHGRRAAAAAGLLLAGAAAAKVSYALPAAAYGVYTLFARGRHPAWVALGTLPAVALVGWTFAEHPAGFLYGTFVFPATAPAEYYAATGRLWKLSQAIKPVDGIKFLVLGPALLALGVVAFGRRVRRLTLLDWLILAGLVAALLPSPTWRQYFLPLLPPTFVRLAQLWSAHPPARWLRVAAVTFAIAGLAPSIAAVVRASHEVPMLAAMREGAALRKAMDEAALAGPVATLSPQFVPAAGRAIDPRFAAGPFHFRSRGLVRAQDERGLHLVSRTTLAILAERPPGAILVGGEGRWTSGEDALDHELAGWVLAHGWQRVPLASRRFRLYAAARRLSARSAE